MEITVFDSFKDTMLNTDQNDVAGFENQLPCSYGFEHPQGKTIDRDPIARAISQTVGNNY